MGFMYMHAIKNLCTKESTGKVDDADCINICVKCKETEKGEQRNEMEKWKMTTSHA